MKKLTKKKARVAGTAAVVALTATGAQAEELTLNNLSIVTTGAQVKAKKLPSDAVQVSGGDTGLRLGFAKALEKAPPKSAISSVAFGLKHIDAGPHSFELSLGSVGTVSIQCDEKGTARPAAVTILCNDRAANPAAKVKILCNDRAADPKAKVKILCNDHPATIAPTFAGAGSYSLKVSRAGKLVKSLSGLKGAFTIPDFDDGHDGHEETVGLALSYGTERKGAWTITVTHGDYVVAMTAEGQQPPATADLQLAVKTGGLSSVTLTDAKVQTFIPKP